MARRSNMRTHVTTVELVDCDYPFDPPILEGAKHLDNMLALLKAVIYDGEPCALSITVRIEEYDDDCGDQEA